MNHKWFLSLFWKINTKRWTKFWCSIICILFLDIFSFIIFSNGWDVAVGSFLSGGCLWINCCCCYIFRKLQSIRILMAGEKYMSDAIVKYFFLVVTTFFKIVFYWRSMHPNIREKRWWNPRRKFAEDLSSLVARIAGRKSRKTHRDIVMSTKTIPGQRINETFQRWKLLVNVRWIIMQLNAFGQSTRSITPPICVSFA